MYWVRSRGKTYQRLDLVVSFGGMWLDHMEVVLNNSIFELLITIREEISAALTCGILGYLSIFHNVILLYYITCITAYFSFSFGSLDKVQTPYKV